MNLLFTQKLYDRKERIWRRIIESRGEIINEKKVLLLVGLVALTACSQSKQATKESTSNQTAKETSESLKKKKV